MREKDDVLHNSSVKTVLVAREHENRRGLGGRTRKDGGVFRKGQDISQGGELGIDGVKNARDKEKSATKIMVIEYRC